MIIKEKEMALDVPPLKVHSDSDDSREVYTHRSLRRHDSRGHTLAILGKPLLDFAIARHWYEKSPDASAQELQQKLEQSLSPDVLEACIIKYELHTKLRRKGANDQVSLEDCRDFLNVYIGALFAQEGDSSVQTWVAALIDPTAESFSSTVNIAAAAAAAAAAKPPASPVSPTIAPTSPTSSTTFPSPISSMQTPPPYTLQADNDGGLNYVTLSTFNEYAMKKQYMVTWDADNSGLAHRPTWTISCLLNGAVKGVGVGSSQKVAKEKAARDAWRTMGWGQTANPTGGSTSMLDFVTVSSFNTIAEQRGHHISWEQDMAGQPHMPTWRLSCIVDGYPRGTGEAKNVYEAKLIAVRKAWESLGW